MILHKPELVEKYTNMGHWGDKTLLQRAAANCIAHPEREAVVDPPNRNELVGTPAQRLTWAEFGRQWMLRQQNCRAAALVRTTY